MADEITVIRVVIPEFKVVRINATLGSGGGGVSSDATLVLNSSGDTNNPVAHPYTRNNTGLVVTDVNGREVFRLWATDPDPSFTNFNIWNVYLGTEAGLSQPTDNVSAGYANTGIGAYSLRSITTGFTNVAVGSESLRANTTGAQNVAVGWDAMLANTTGSENVGVGLNALFRSISGNANTAVGYDSMLDNTTGIQNVAIGKSAGANSQSDNQMTYLGSFSGRSAVGAAITNSIAIGYATTLNASNIAVIGNSGVTDVYFGSTDGLAIIHGVGSGITNLFGVPGGRLTTESGVPVSTSDRTSQGTLYYTPYKHNKIYTWDGSFWRLKSFSEISLSLTLTSGKNYDVFINSAADTLSLSNAWTNDTTRADALATQDGVTVLGSDHTKLWLGTIRASGANVTADSKGGSSSQVGGKRFVWNAYNQVERTIAVIDTTATWTYGTATVRQADGASGNKVEYVTGDAASNMTADARVTIFVAANVAVPAETGVGVDSTTAYSGIVQGGFNADASGVYSPMSGVYSGMPGLGYHYLAWLESGADGTNSIFVGNASPMQSGLTAKGFF